MAKFRKYQILMIVAIMNFGFVITADSIIKTDNTDGKDMTIITSPETTVSFVIPSTSNTTTEMPSSSSTSNSTTEPTTTTTKPTTPTPQSTTTTTKPTTTTTVSPKPYTTTSSTTTTKKHPTSTVPPTSTTHKPATSTVPPTPTPKPDIGNWNTSCVKIQMAAQLNFTYETKDNKSNRAIYNLPSTAKLSNDHSCGELSEQLTLEWGPANAINSFMIQFNKNQSRYSLYTIILTIHTDGDQFPNAKENQTVGLIYTGYAFKTPLSMSYHCTRDQKLNLTETVQDKEIIGTIDLTNIQFEAFRQKNSTRFSTALDCDAAIDTPDIVPIAVGVALIALIIVILTSYLVARRRSTNRGYLSF